MFIFGTIIAGLKCILLKSTRFEIPYLRKIQLKTNFFQSHKNIYDLQKIAKIHFDQAILNISNKEKCFAYLGHKIDKMTHRQTKKYPKLNERV